MHLVGAILIPLHFYETMMLLYRQALGSKAKIRCTRKGEQYAFAPVKTQGHTAKLDDILRVQV